MHLFRCQLFNFRPHLRYLPVQSGKNIPHRCLLIGELESLPRPGVAADVDIGAQHHLVHARLPIPLEHALVQLTGTPLAADVRFEPEHGVVGKDSTFCVVVGPRRVPDLVSVRVVDLHPDVQRIRTTVDALHDDVQPAVLPTDSPLQLRQHPPLVEWHPVRRKQVPKIRCGFVRASMRFVVATGPVRPLGSRVVVVIGFGRFRVTPFDGRKILPLR